MSYYCYFVVVGVVVVAVVVVAIATHLA